MPNRFETDSTCLKTLCEGNNHQENTKYEENVLSICSDMFNLKISSSEDENVSVSDKCDVCVVVFTSPVNAKQHFEGKKHKKKVESQSEAIFPNRTPENPFADCQTPVNLPVNNEYKCDVCNVAFTSHVIAKQHFEGKRHQKNVKSQPIAVVSNSLPDNYSQGFHTQENMPVINQDKCELCDVKFTSATQTADHLKGKIHMKNFNTVSALRKNIKLECDICGVVFAGIVDADAHFTGRKHLRATENRTILPRLIAELASPQKLPSVAAENHQVGDKCEICDVVFTSRIIAKQHFEGKKHKKKVLNESVNSKATLETSGVFTPTDISSKNQHKCDACNVVLASAANATNHLKCENHLETISNDFVRHSTGKEFNINDNYNKSYSKNI
ncbi:zinc finger protein 346 [Octopus bimaculoides]|uniref:Matrin-type domain-containing protein n=1 Tax=Octopus bimaculoides TaxID=37653 RepID=A0A0L8FKW5_OCTBM|nr:zinc finger protein 346 [Octopus bimaculoides]XP_052828449.1 zinc finger protein 346 [Octopus bimaculoides]XP_052828450.1 zinc finger protein 346 [Octopus bimaculoides]XP_052828451.1 zinc finger protein 346 [Octopus bimaculoides]|eukprot:XP_014788917.1 PREDICTED: zinc finger protein 346-like [Octopus bimaculoides]